MNMLELFSGSGVLSKRFRLGGWYSTEIDLINGHDVMIWKPKMHYDFVWASPPCTEYSGLRYTYSHIWKADRTLWLRTLELIQDIRPRYWIIENVKMAQWIWGHAPYHYGSFFLWGYYPIPKKTISWKTNFKGTHLDRKNKRRWNDKRSAEDKARLPASLCDLMFETIDKALPKDLIRPMLSV